MDEHSQMRRSSPLVVSLATTDTKIQESKRLAAAMDLFVKYGGEVKAIPAGITSLNFNGKAAIEAADLKRRALSGNASQKQKARG